MPYCKHCKARISKLDKDICPFCGEKNPLEGVKSQTVDITANISSLGDKINNYKLYKNKSKKLMLFLNIFFGIFGAHAFYLRRFSLAFSNIVFSACLILGIGLTFGFIELLPFWSSFLLAYAFCEIFMIIEGIYLFTRHDLTDGRGDFVR